MRWIQFAVAFLMLITIRVRAESFSGKHYAGDGDVEYLRLLDISRRMFEPDPQYQNLSMLYTPTWNGLVEGPTWDMWWIQNSYGTTYNILPFLREPYVTFLQNSQDQWFDQMGDGKRAGEHGWVGPDGCLCDAAAPGKIYYRQGDGKVDIHDWGMEFTAAGLLMQSELLLISRDRRAIEHYLPKLERCANFIESRRDPKNDLFLAGPAGNLLAPSYAGYKKPDGSYDKAYLAGLSVTYIAALDRLIEVEKLGGDNEKAAVYRDRRIAASRGLAKLTTPEGYFVRSIDPDGVVHGVYGAAKHGYLETSPNHDAIAFRVVDEIQAEKIYKTIAGIPGLRPHDFILPNYPSYDDMYEQPQGLWGFGTWVNGGHWSTCEGRMILAYARLGHFEDIKRSMRQLMKFADQFRMDNPLTDCGNAVYQPNEPINLCYDTFAPAAGMMRGLFEYLYKADRLILVPHIPPGITRLEQRDPVRFGRKKIYLVTYGSGKISAVSVNGKPWARFGGKEITLSFDGLPDEAHVAISMGGAKSSSTSAPLEMHNGWISLQLSDFISRMTEAGLGDSYEAAHARLVMEAQGVIGRRQNMIEAGEIKKLPTKSQEAADKSYVDTAKKLEDGLRKTIESYRDSSDARKKRVYECWQAFH